MKKTFILSLLSITLMASPITVKVNGDIKITSWEEDSGFFNPVESFDSKTKDTFYMCILKKESDIDNLILCLENGTNKTYGVNSTGTFITKDSFIPTDGFLNLNELSVKIGG